MAKRERTNNNLQNTTQKTKYRSTQTPLKPGVNSGALDEIQIHAPSGTRRVASVYFLFIMHWISINCLSKNPSQVNMRLTTERLPALVN